MPQTSTHTDLYTHREAQVYSFYADDLKAHAEATNADAKADVKVEAKGTEE